MQQIQACDIPISPDDMRRVYVSHDANPEKFRSEHIICPTGHVSINSKLFVMLLETMRSIVDATDWDKRTRIVLEYDPRVEKMNIVTFTESV